MLTRQVTARPARAAIAKASSIAKREL